MKYAINNDLNGIELYFDNKPEAQVLNDLKANGWKWHNKKSCWYNRNNAETLKTAEALINGEPVIIEATEKAAKVTYYKNVSDYITIEEFEKELRKFYKVDDYGGYGRYSKEETERYIDHALKNHYNNDNDYYNISRYIRQAIVWKSIGRAAEKFRCNGDNAKYLAVWDKLPIIEGLKKTGKIYSAMWGYDQTQITTATHYGKAFGLDVLVTGGFGSGDVLLKRISKDGTFSESCMYFSPNTYTDKEIQETNEYASYHGR